MLHVSVSGQAPAKTDETNVVSPKTKGTVLSTLQIWPLLNTMTENHFTSVSKT